MTPSDVITLGFLVAGTWFFLLASAYYTFALHGALMEKRDKKRLYDHLMENATVIQTVPQTRHDA